ncbi:hypothetical protein HYW99_02060 [Candidatus Woesearchaeota archaeon]|nr:hypothetical protein [Candidatus Woesearchaeota archaeon]
MKKIKEKIVGLMGSFTGTLSFLGGYQVCHNACLALIYILTILGFTVAGMPLLFLTKVAIPFWTVAISLLTITIILKYKKIMNMSNKILLFNSGLIIVGVPFQQVQNFNYVFWIMGGILVVSSIGWFIYDKIKKE